MPELVAHEQQAQAALLEDLERLVGHIGLGVAGPGDAERPQAVGDLFGARTVVGEGVVVEEELLDLRELRLGARDLGHHVGSAARAVAVPADRLRPEAEGAARLAATAGIEREVGMQQIADEVILDHEVALVDVDHPGQRIHVLDDGALGIVHHRAVALVAQPENALERAALRHLLDGEVELGAADEIDGFAREERLVGRDRDMGAHQPDEERRIRALEGFRHLDVGIEGGRAGMHDQKVVVRGERQHVVDGEAARGRVDQLAAGHERRGLGEPGRIPEGANLALRLIARAGAAVEALVGGRIEEERSHEISGTVNDER